MNMGVVTQYLQHTYISPRLILGHTVVTFFYVIHMLLLKQPSPGRASQSLIKEGEA
jgi:hypothetical protein